MEKQDTCSGAGGVYSAWSPMGAPPLLNGQREYHLKQFDNSVNAVSFGFVATAILISMFLVMAIFERFLRPNSSTSRASHADLESQMGLHPKLGHPSPKIVYATEVSVLMPGDSIPTFLAHPAPIPCSTDDISMFQKQQISSSLYQPPNMNMNTSSTSTSTHGS